MHSGISIPPMRVQAPDHYQARRFVCIARRPATLSAIGGFGVLLVENRLPIKPEVGNSSIS
jgi:hypothetical protein